MPGAKRVGEREREGIVWLTTTTFGGSSDCVGGCHHPNYPWLDKKKAN